MNINESEWVRKESDLFDSGDPDICYALHTDEGSLTVLDRMTGFGHRDTESAFRDTPENDSKFYLVSGDFDIRTHNLNFKDSVDLIKKLHKENSEDFIGTMLKIANKGDS